MESISLTYGDYKETVLEKMVERCGAYINMVDLSGNNLSGEQIMNIVNKYINKMHGLTTLDIKDNKIGPKGAIYLFDNLHKYCKQIKYLDVNENSIHDDALYSLAVLLCHSKLEVLNLVTNHITPRGLPTLCDGVQRSTSLTSLSLAFNLLDDEGAIILANALSHHPSLTHLDVSDNHIGDMGAIALAKAFIIEPNSKLEMLNLSVNHIGDVGFSALGDALTRTHNKHFTLIDLGCNSAVRDAGRRAFISSVHKMKYVYAIDLTSCDLADDDAIVLIDALNSPLSSVCCVEWYNNPRISLETERLLDNTLKTKQVNKAENVFSNKSLSVSAFTLFLSITFLAARLFIKRKMLL